MKRLLLTLVILLALPISLYAADVQFQWGASTGVVDGYRIYSNNDANTIYPNELKQVDGNTLTTTVTLDDSLTYYLIVRAFNEYGESGNSNSVVWYSVPSPPTNFRMIQ